MERTFLSAHVRQPETSILIRYYHGKISWTLPKELRRFDVTVRQCFRPPDVNRKTAHFNVVHSPICAGRQRCRLLVIEWLSVAQYVRSDGPATVQQTASLRYRIERLQHGITSPRFKGASLVGARSPVAVGILRGELLHRSIGFLINQGESRVCAQAYFLSAFGQKDD